jgi:glycosyltransferase involved in cell wall biosynthesis
VTRIPVLYLAPWIDIGGSDTATIDWFRFLDQERFCASLITTQPSANRRLSEVVPYAEELWELPELISGNEFPRFILSFIHSRAIRLVHIMNSRLGFELLPDIASLPDPPTVVVQLHGEEPNGAGYPRYVATRYGNLVDAFSMTTETLHERLDAYDVPAVKRRVIPIGVDAEREFAPGRAQPIAGLDPAAFHILFAARLTAQKDPLLMLEVAGQLQAAGLRFQIHVLGDGELTNAVRDRIAKLGYQGEVILHGACIDIAPWYAACGAVLLTSAFETSPPRAAHEAMAMGLSIVAPDLPELRELVTADAGLLIAPRDDSRAYCDAIRALAEDSGVRHAIGSAARDRIRAEFTVQRMAAEHGALYEQLLARRSPPGRAARAARPPAERPLGHRRPLRRSRIEPAPLVSVIVTCFDQGRYLRGCLKSVAAQAYRPIETIVVDDCSSDPETLDVLMELDRSASVALLRLPANRGPAAARNAAIASSHGRYILPLDADDLLADGAVAELVAQMTAAGDQIGFIYPNIQFFGNRVDYIEMPSYNLDALLDANYCAVSSLVDAHLFERGFRYAEEIRLGHEDWDFVVTLAEHGIYGEPARSTTLLARKSGFTRSDLVAATVPFGEVLAERHPALFARRDTIKHEWNPALTLVALDPLPPIGGLGELERVAERQTCQDFELSVRTSERQTAAGLERRLWAVPDQPPASRAKALADGLQMARGRWTLAVYGSLAMLLEDPATVEKVLRILSVNRGVTALALADFGPGKPRLSRLQRDAVAGAPLTALSWTTVGAAAPPASLSLAGQRPLEILASWLTAQTTVEWRQMPRGGDHARADADDQASAELGTPRLARAADVRFRMAPAALPACPPGFDRRLPAIAFWRPPQSQTLCRHRNRSTGRYVYTNIPGPPDGCDFDRVLGCVRELPFAGTLPLLATEDDRGFGFGEHVGLTNPDLLGFVEQQPLPLLDPLLVGRDPVGGHWVLVGGEDDPRANGLRDTTLVGYLEPHPIRPRLPAHADVGYGLVGLVRAVDLKARRHRYAAGGVPPGVAAGELGALFAEPLGDCSPLWLDDQGWVIAEAHSSSPGSRPSPRTALRWTGDPLSWNGFGTMPPKLRAVGRRAYDSARILTARPTPNGRPKDVGGQPPAGYLLQTPARATLPLYQAVHPVTGDRLLSTSPSEPRSFGYRDLTLLGYVVKRAPVTGRLGLTHPGAPWAAKFGRVISPEPAPLVCDHAPLEPGVSKRSTRIESGD